jgi:hypothetical protein
MQRICEGERRQEGEISGLGWISQRSACLRGTTDGTCSVGFKERNKGLTDDGKKARE